jgi:tRNA 2-thiouridine synthesizing protein A
MTEPDVPKTNDEMRTEDLVRAVTLSTGTGCARCRKSICGHEAVMSVLLGFKKEPRCVVCIAAELGRDADEIARQVGAQVRHRECFDAAWKHVGRLEGTDDPLSPACLAARADAARRGIDLANPQTIESAQELRADEFFDAGDMGCGDLVLELRFRLKAMRPGSVLDILAKDPGAPQDLPAWCGLTGHHLMSADHPRYRIRRKKD